VFGAGYPKMEYNTALEKSITTAKLLAVIARVFFPKQSLGRRGDCFAESTLSEANVLAMTDK
jgi:hypothetical protein